MKLVRFGDAGSEKPGIVDDNGSIRDLSSVLSDISGKELPTIGTVLAGINIQQLPLVPEGVRLGSCITGVGNFIAVGLNYADHAAESGMPVPAEPVLFNKAPSCIVGPNDTVLIPRGSQKTDWEVELAIVIGKTASYVTEDEAANYVAGYCVCNDVSERSYQLERGELGRKARGVQHLVRWGRGW